MRWAFGLPAAALIACGRAGVVAIEPAPVGPGLSDGGTDPMDGGHDEPDGSPVVRPADGGAAAGDGGSPARPPQLSSSYTLAWSDEFEGQELDATRWTLVGPGPHRGGFNTYDAVTVADGALSIEVYTDGGVNYGAVLSTLGQYQPTFGYVEARIRFHDAPGEWCAFWMQSPTNGNPPGDPSVAGAEIDIAEHRAVDQSGTDIGDTYAININYDGYGADHKIAGQFVTAPPGAPSLQGNWHRYGVLWTDQSYEFYLDDQRVWSTQTAVSGRSESIWLSCEVQSGLWAGVTPQGGYGPRGEDNPRLEVDWVRVWQQH